MITSDASVKLDFVSSDDKFLADGELAIVAIEKKKCCFFYHPANSSDELFKQEIKCLVLESAIQKP